LNRLFDGVLDGGRGGSRKLDEFIDVIFRDQLFQNANLGPSECGDVRSTHGQSTTSLTDASPRRALE
jgi:hypothetical protein